MKDISKMRLAGQVFCFLSPPSCSIWPALFIALQACAYNPAIQREQLLLVSEPQMQALGADSWTDYRTQTPETKDSALRAKAERVSNRILTAKGETPSSWEVIVFEDAALNAFALPGRKIGLNAGMVRFCRTDDELAAIIGHEIAHVELRHAAERTSQDLAARGIMSLIVPEDTNMESIFGIGTTLGVLLPFSRKHELEADQIGLRYMAAAGYDPRAAIDLWTRMAGQAGRGGTPTFLSTHPADSQRIDALRAEADRLSKTGS
jgi:predicted Zn-dependent protease